jgi:hypothetical protein
METMQTSKMGGTSMPFNIWTWHFVSWYKNTYLLFAEYKFGTWKMHKIMGPIYFPLMTDFISQQYRPYQYPFLLNKQEIPGRTNCLLSFETTQTA